MVAAEAWIFVMVLAFSWLMVVRIVFDQKIETWLRCHAEAFAELGGVPKVIVPDNLKAAVIRAGFGVDDNTTLNRSYRELARFHGFQVDPTPVYAPEKKGKVESAVKYVKNNFFAARKDKLDIVELRVELRCWLDKIANARVHGTPSVGLQTASRSSASICCRCRVSAGSWCCGATPRSTPTRTCKSLERCTRCPGAWSASPCSCA